MLDREQRALYDAFYRSTESPQHLDDRTEILIGLAAALALDCHPCADYYLKRARTTKISDAELGEVVAKVMAVAAGQKRLQAQQAFARRPAHSNESP